MSILYEGDGSKSVITMIGNFLNLVKIT